MIPSLNKIEILAKGDTFILLGVKGLRKQKIGSRTELSPITFRVKGPITLNRLNLVSINL